MHRSDSPLPQQSKMLRQLTPQEFDLVSGGVRTKVCSQGLDRDTTRVCNFDEV